ncbi:hypothetical protein SKAU_G00238550 [Synaphobranchus kaupii]|uniref:Uncharacterized protein n=1 Tax=Synaphobranchus kaupii TaxID=118154 RepID=A0A9Q1F7K1_SYNKA|nr:hypothetical protein SKAU_G00238550 [Synaphobranchus kaupii]
MSPPPVTSPPPSLSEMVTLPDWQAESQATQLRTYAPCPTYVPPTATFPKGSATVPPHPVHPELQLGSLWMRRLLNAGMGMRSRETAGTVPTDRPFCKCSRDSRQTRPRTR